MSNNSPHIEFENLTDFVLGAVSAAERSPIAEHLRGCAICSTKHSRVEKTIGVMKSDRLEEVPPHILKRTFALLADRATEVAKPTLIQKLTAFLQTETASLVPAYGLRSGQSENARRLWFSAENADIDLRIRKIGDAWEVDGQVFAGFVGGRAVLRTNQSDESVEISDVGQFSFGAVSEGEYSLLLVFPEFEIEVPAVRISE